MKHTLTRFLFIALACFAPLIGWGQTTVSISTLPYNPGVTDFNTYDPTNAAKTSSNPPDGTLPNGWNASGASNYRGRVSSGTPSSGGFYAFGTSGGDYAIGALRSSSNNYTYSVSFINNSGSVITDLTLSWGYKQFTYSNASGWSVAGTGGLAGNSTLTTKSFTGSSTGTNGTITTTNVPSFTLAGVNIAVGATFGISWTTTDATGSDNLIGIDNFSITAVNVPACTGPTDSASVFSATAIATNAAILGWTSGNGTARVAFLKAGAFTTATPVANTTYTANNSFTGNGTGFDGGKTVYNNSGNSVSVTDLTPNTLYNAKVFEYLGAAGAECYNTTALPGNFTTISNPATTTAATVVGANGFTANWTAPTGNGSAALTYTLEVATDNAFATIVSTTANIAGTNQAIGSLTPSTTYYYRVKVVNAGGTSAVSNTTTVTTLPEAPPAPTVTPACGSSTLQAYTGPAAATYYWQGTSATGTSIASPATADYIVNASGTYYVRAYNGSQWSTATSVAVTVAQNPAITTQPSNTSVGAGSTATFTVVANNAGSYQWQENSGSGFVNLTNNAQYSGVNTATLTVSNTTLFMDYYQYRVVVKAAAPCTVDVNSTSATLNVTPVSNATDYFRSRTTGLYGNASTWESSVDSITWINATLAPTNVARSVTIRATDSVTVATSGRSAAHLYVFGKLTLSGQNLAIADSSGYDVVIFSGGRFDCGTNTSGNGFNLPTNASVLVKTGGRIIARINTSLNEPVRISTKYFYEDAAVVEYTGSGAITTGSNATYSLPTTSVGAIPILLFNNTIGNSGANTTTTFNCFVELGTGYTIPWTGDGQKVFNGGLLINGEMRFNNNTPFVISGTNTTLAGSGTITLGTGTGANTGGMSIASGANVQLLSDVTINGISTLTATLSGTLNTNGHKISGTAKFATAAGSTLVVTDAAGLTGSGTSGNIQTTGTRTFSTSGNYIYRGTAAQATGDGLTGSATLEIDNAAGVTLSAAHTATTGLTLTSGNLTTTTTNLLTLGSAAVLTGGSATAFVAGPLKRATAAATDFLFPIGKPGDYAPVTITPQTATASDYTAEYFNGAQLTPNRGNKAASLKYVAANEYFDISRGTGADAKVTLTYTTAAQVTDPSTLVVAHYTGGQWVSEGGTATGNNNSGTVISGNFVSSFSPFALGSTSAAQPLPLQLLSFSARPAARAALLDWELATPDGGEQIVVERSNDGSDFTALGRFDLTKETPLRQRFTDESPLTGPNYYRLRITGVDGVVTHSPVRTLHFGAVATSDLRLYPNPAHDVLNLEWTSTEAPAHIQLFTSAGRLVLSEKVLNKANVSLSVSGFVPGVYWVVFEQGGKTERRQVQIGH